MKENDKVWLWIVLATVGIVLILAVFLVICLHSQSSNRAKKPTEQLYKENAEIKDKDERQQQSNNPKQLIKSPIQPTPITEKDLSENELLGIASDIEKKINVLVDFTNTKCFPSKPGKSFLFICDKPIFSLEYENAAKKGWILVVVGAVGNFMNENPNTRIDDYSIYMTDTSSVQNQKAYIIKSLICRDLQYQIKNDKISLDEMYQSIWKSLVEKQLNR